MPNPIPAPPLDGVPPSPPGVNAGGGPNPTLSQLTPSAQLGGSAQTIAVSLQAIAQAAKLIDMVGQTLPAFAPMAQNIIQQMRDGLKSSLQQGTGTSEPAGNGLPQMAQMPLPQGNPGPAASQQPLPPLGAGVQ